VNLEAYLFPAVLGFMGAQIVSVKYDECSSKESRENYEIRIKERRNSIEYAGIGSGLVSLYSINNRHVLYSPSLQDSICIDSTSGIQPTLSWAGTVGSSNWRSSGR